MMKNSKIIKIAALTLWAALFFSTLSLSMGSFGEMEPKAGAVFGTMAGIILVAGFILCFFLSNKSKGKNQTE